MLNKKKREYVRLRRAGVNQRDSAVQAGYSISTADQAASRLEKDPEIQNAINAREGELITVATDKKTGKEQQAFIPEDPEPEWKTEGDYDYKDPKDYLLWEMNNPHLNKAVRHDAAKALLPFFHGKVGDKGKKEEAKEKAQSVGKGRFGQTQGPLRSIK